MLLCWTGPTTSALVSSLRRVFFRYREKRGQGIKILGDRRAMAVAKRVLRRIGIISTMSANQAMAVADDATLTCCREGARSPLAARTPQVPRLREATIKDVSCIMRGYFRPLLRSLQWELTPPCLTSELSGAQFAFFTDGRSGGVVGRKTVSATEGK
jgi:hypothetical protein